MGLGIDAGREPGQHGDVALGQEPGHSARSLAATLSWVPRPDDGEGVRVFELLELAAVEEEWRTVVHPPEVEGIVVSEHGREP
jgi:hypothetical protein